MLYNNIYELVGNTPLLKLNSLIKKYDIQAKIYVKLESFNPSGSIKDRIALAMIQDAESKEQLKNGSVIVEPTSGNTGIGLALIAAAKGYRTIITMPETMSIERRNLIKAYGAEIVLTPGSEGMKGAIAKAKELVTQYPNAFMPSQFTNQSNPNAHYLTTGPEIWRDTDGKIDYIIGGVGTGGTISGVAKYLKERNNKIKAIAVEPSESPVLSGGKPGAHKIQGIGAGFIPETFWHEYIDQIIKIDSNTAFNTGRSLAQIEGLLVGISSGAAVAAAIKVAKENNSNDINIVVILPDTGNRYLSTSMFEK